jgi:cysteine desulfurase/selenocysteine lyase
MDINRKRHARIGIVVLAAGGSTRMGDQKLLLELGGKSIVRRSAESALSSKAHVVTVIVGSDASRVAACIDDLPLRIMFNHLWQNGQGTSIACGISDLAGCDAAIIMVADQPFVNEHHLNKLIDYYQHHGGQIVVSSVCGIKGNPALFAAELFPELRMLDGDQGARQLFSRFEVNTVEQNEPFLFNDIDDKVAFGEVEKEWFLRYGLRDRFPLLRGESGLAYLDSAATTQIPDFVLHVQERFEKESRANIHRGIYSLAEKSSDAYEQARKIVSGFFGVSSEGAIFTHGATESLNLAVFGWGASQLKEGDIVLVDKGGHHANIVPWQMLSQRIGIKLEFIELDECGLIDQNSWHSLLNRKPKAVALTHISNVTGLENDLSLLVREAHDANAVVIADCAQSAGHIPLSFSASEIDFAAVSAHKMYGPFGIGLLWVAPNCLEEMQPVLGGGGIIERVNMRGFQLTSPPTCFEAGTPNITGAIGFAAACNFINDIGLEAIAEHGRGLCGMAQEQLSKIEGISIVGGMDEQRRTSIVSFTLDSVHPHDIAETLSQRGVAVRAGRHCAMPLHDALGIPASIRASFGVYSTKEDVSRLVQGVQSAREVYKTEGTRNHDTVSKPCIQR